MFIAILIPYMVGIKLLLMVLYQPLLGNSLTIDGNSNNNIIFYCFNIQVILILLLRNCYFP